MKRYLAHVGILALLLSGTAQAAAVVPAPPELMLTWSAANSFVPAAYAGRIMPSTDGMVTLAVQLVDNHKLVAQPDATFEWYINNRLVTSGKNITHFSFKTADYLSNNSIRVRMTDYNTSAAIEKTLYLPQSRSLVAITTPYPNNGISLAGSMLEALPYFFPAKTLDEISFAWQVGDQGQTTPSNHLLVTSTGGGAKPSRLMVKVTASSKDTLTTLATGSISALVQ